MDSFWHDSIFFFYLKRTSKFAAEQNRKQKQQHNRITSSPSEMYSNSFSAPPGGGGRPAAVVAAAAAFFMTASLTDLASKKGTVVDLGERCGFGSWLIALLFVFLFCALWCMKVQTANSKRQLSPQNHFASILYLNQQLQLQLQHQDRPTSGPRTSTSTYLRSVSATDELPMLSSADAKSKSIT